MSLEDSAWQAITAVHAVATWWLVGMIWTIQMVHYPSFASIEPSQFSEFQQKHSETMGWLVGAPWLIEGLSVLALFLLAPDNTTRVIAAVGGILALVVIAVTITKSIPAHEILSGGFSQPAHDRLVSTNWWRTLSWTARGVVALLLLLR